MDDEIPWMGERSPTSNLPSTRRASTLLSCEMGKITNSISNLQVHARYFTSLLHSMVKTTLEAGTILIPYYWTDRQWRRLRKGEGYVQNQVSDSRAGLSLELNQHHVSSSPVHNP